MTYTKKKIVVEVEVPDGATHCLQTSSGIAAFFMQEDGCIPYFWNFRTTKWEKTNLKLMEGSIIQPIEVIE